MSEDLDLQARYERAKIIAQEAARMGMAFYRQRDGLTVEHKSGRQDVVSQADKALETYIRGELARHFPEDGLLGEEHGADALGARCIWVIDPIDGTACFLNGLPSWCVSIGLLADGEPVVGVIADPNHGELFHACKGRGAFANATQIKVSQAQNLREGLMGVGTFHEPNKESFIPFLERLLAADGMFIRNGSAALMTAYVAAGRLLAYYETHLKSWDCLAGLVLVKEAGGVASDFLANEGLLNGNPYLVACPGVYEQARSLIGAILSG